MRAISYEPEQKDAKREDVKSLELEIINLHRELIAEREYCRRLERRIQHLERLGEEID